MTKKSETLEIRVSYELKSKLADLSEQRGSSMSELVRGVIDRELAGPSPDTVGEDEMPIRTLSRFAPKTLYLLPVLLLAGLYWGSAQTPAQATPMARIFFAELDRDGDGVITEPELYQFLTEEEGLIVGDDCDVTEESCTPEAIAAEEINRADSNADGHVEYSEFEIFYLAERAVEFLEYDADENGVVSPDEFVAMEVRDLIEFPDPEMDEPLSAECLTMVESDKIEGIAKACIPAHELRMVMAEFDADFDGRVTLREFLQN
ncbi:EF-hand domain-containing protein [Ruegeria atlantica]|uniref:EF hand n=1 Tax=Ruegeria atlantica TaxID=81569 RepID=A0A0P1E0X1_9RHOB|nr:EF-hand domain-containing protein [Ruegeria atlantica]CUH41383.1 EF hand [Ruegeria atlantica]